MVSVVRGLWNVHLKKEYLPRPRYKDLSHMKTKERHCTGSRTKKMTIFNVEYICPNMHYRRHSVNFRCWERHSGNFWLHWRDFDKYCFVSVVQPIKTQVTINVFIEARKRHVSLATFRCQWDMPQFLRKWWREDVTIVTVGSSNL